MKTHEQGLRRLHPLDDALEAMCFGWRGMTHDADQYLATLGLSRVHHRMLYVIARREGITITELLEILASRNRPCTAR